MPPKNTAKSDDAGKQAPAEKPDDVTTAPAPDPDQQKVTADAGDTDQQGQATGEGNANAVIANELSGTHQAGAVHVQDDVARIAHELGTQAAAVVSAIASMFGPVGYIVRCHRESGIWRAGRFWPPENVPVPAHEVTPEQLEALRAEPLLSVQPVQE